MRPSIGIANLQNIFTICFVMKLSEGTFNAKNVQGFQIEKMTSCVSLSTYTTILCFSGFKTG